MTTWFIADPPMIVDRTIHADPCMIAEFLHIIDKCQTFPTNLDALSARLTTEVGTICRWLYYFNNRLIIANIRFAVETTLACLQSTAMEYP